MVLIKIGGALLGAIWGGQLCYYAAALVVCGLWPSNTCGLLPGLIAGPLGIFAGALAGWLIARWILVSGGGAIRKQTRFGIVVCVLAVVPGALVGDIAALIYKAMMAREIGDNPGFFILRAIGIETPSAVMKWVFLSAFPAAVQGGIAGAIAVAITYAIYKGPNIKIAAYTTGAFYSGVIVMAYSGVIVMALIMGLAINGFKPTDAEAVFQIIGLWIGLGAVASSVPKHQPVADSA